jgi:hypothetical protein
MGMRTAVVAVAVMLAAGCAQAASTGKHEAESGTVATPSSPSASMAADLTDTLDHLPLPPRSVRLATAAVPGQTAQSCCNSPAKVTRTGYWRSPLATADTLAWLTSRLRRPWSGGPEGTSGGTTTMAEYDRPSTSVDVEGPGLEVSVQDVPGGSSVIATAWMIPLPSKSPDESFTDVTAATVWKQPLDSALTAAKPAGSITLLPDQLRRLVVDLRSLQPDDGSPASCNPQGPTELVLDLTTTGGDRRLILGLDCSHITAVPAEQPILDDSTTLDNDVAAALTTRG